MENRRQKTEAYHTKIVRPERAHSWAADIVAAKVLSNRKGYLVLLKSRAQQGFVMLTIEPYTEIDRSLGVKTFKNGPEFEEVLRKSQLLESTRS